MILTKLCTLEPIICVPKRGTRSVPTTQRTSSGALGGCQGILRDPRIGVLMGGSDLRKNSIAIGS
jgi:hypothetical protein